MFQRKDELLNVYLFAVYISSDPMWLCRSRLLISAWVYISITHHNLKHSCLRESCIVGNVKARFELECGAQKKDICGAACSSGAADVIGLCVEECVVTLSVFSLNVSVILSVMSTSFLLLPARSVTPVLCPLWCMCVGGKWGTAGWWCVCVCVRLYSLCGGHIMTGVPPPPQSSVSSPPPLRVSVMVTPQASKRRQESDSSLPTQTDYTFIHAAKEMSQFHFRVCSHLQFLIPEVLKVCGKMVLNSCKVTFIRSVTKNKTNKHNSFIFMHFLKNVTTKEGK